jgi:hypothetical protein
LPRLLGRPRGGVKAPIKWFGATRLALLALIGFAARCHNRVTLLRTGVTWLNLGVPVKLPEGIRDSLLTLLNTRRRTVSTALPGRLFGAGAPPWRLGSCPAFTGGDAVKPRRHPYRPSRKKIRGRRKSVAGRGTSVRLTPAALYVYAADYLRAAKRARLTEKSFRPAQYYLVCHALELVLRAFLSLSGKVPDDSGPVAWNRNLGDLLAEAERSGLRDFVLLDASAVAEIRRASLYYAGAVFDFPALAEALRGYPQRPSMHVLLAAAEDLVSAAREPCLSMS